MGEIALPTKECRGVDIPDAMGNPSGEVIRAHRPGYIQADGSREKILRRFLNSPSSLMAAVPQNGAVDECPSCGGHMFPWQKICGGCYASGESR